MNTKTVRAFILNSCCCGALFLITVGVRAELTDVTQTTPNVLGGAVKTEMGLESPDPVLYQVSAPNTPVKTASPVRIVSDPTLGETNRPPVCSPSEDGDHDGAVNEVDLALIDHMELYLLNYFKTGTGEMIKRAEHGLDLMKAIECNIQNLRISYDHWAAGVEARFDPKRGLFNHLFATATALFNTVNDG